MKVSEFFISFSKENIYHMIDCCPDNPVYEQVEEEYAQIQDIAYAKIKPCAFLSFGKIPASIANETVPEGSQVLYVITTLGRSISNWCSELFTSNNYLDGMLVDAMADDYLFQMEEKLENIIISMCQEKGFGIVKRIEAPSGINMKVQRVALETIKECEKTEISIKESFMYDPLKTTCQVYLLKKGGQEYHIQHNCKECSAISCKQRKKQQFKVTVEELKEDKKTVCIVCKEGQSIHEALIKNEILFHAVCGGRGTCGKCRICVLRGEIPISEEDKRFFTKEELKDGMRLACKAYPKTDCKIALKTEREEKFAVVTEFDKKWEDNGVCRAKANSKAMGISIDIGTTTIAMQLINITNGQIIDTYTAMNRQRAYGADVISRILSANQGNQKELKECIVQDLKKGVHTLLEKNGLEQLETPVFGMSIVGNTTMIHLLMGYSCETLGVFPFTPVCIDTIRLNWTELTKETYYRIPVVILPGISAYVGSDITAGILACGMDYTEDITLFLDLGTNGEMAVRNCKQIITASAAAGPAFEGGNILWGTGSIPGAICNVTIENKKAQINTIEGREPIGICGTGVIETVYELLKENVIDETGGMEEYFEEGFLLTENAEGKNIVFTQKDVREIQLAKAAIRAGIETLLLHFGICSREVKKIYVAGGFGYQMDFKKAIGIGLFPKVFKDRITAVGNSSLRGAVQYLVQKDAAERMQHIIENTTEVSLSNDKDFNEKYMEYMYFDNI